MTTIELKRSGLPPVGFGLSSVVLGATGLLLFIVPILGIPIGASGIMVGLAGMIVAFLGGRASVRLCVAGVMLSSVAIVLLCGIALAPSGYFSPRPVFPEMAPVQERPYVSPPAPPPSAPRRDESWSISRMHESQPR